ncbi:MAG: autotransporter-associated beta strand repeat-containing protein [Pirellulales bacterium]
MMFSGVGISRAVAETFTNAGGDRVWSNPANWTGGVPTSNAATDLTMSGASAYSSINDLGVLLLNSLALEASTGSVLRGAGLQFAGADAAITQSTAGTFTLGVDSLEILDLLTLNGAGTGLVTIHAPISGAGGLLKTGTSTFVLTGNNSFTGGLTIREGTIIVNALGGYDSVSPLGSGAITLGGMGTTGILSLATVSPYHTAASIVVQRDLALAAGGFGQFDVASTLFANIRGTISGSGGLIKSGAGTLGLYSANTYDGGTDVVAGTLAVRHSQALGTGAVDVGASGAVQLFNGVDVDNSLTLNGGTGLRNSLGANIWSGDILLVGSSIIQSDGGTLTLAGEITGSGAAPHLTLQGAAGGTVSGKIVLAGTAQLIKSQAGTWRVTNDANSFAGNVQINGGVLEVTSVSNSTVASAIGVGTGIGLTGGTLRYIGSGHSTNRTVTITTTAGTLDASGTGTVNFNNVTSTNVALTLTGSGAGTLGVIGIGSAALTKTGAGTWTLLAASTYTGATNVQAGTLSLAGSAGVLSATSAPTISGGRLLLDSTVAASSSRIGNVTVTLSGGELALIGNASTDIGEGFGNFAISSGFSTVTVTPLGAGAQLVANTAATTRAVGAGVLFRGENLGLAPGPGNGNIFFSAVPTLVGGGGAAGTTSISILPWAVGGLSSTSLGTEFVTYGADGIRPLASVEYTSTIPAGAISTQNYKITSLNSLSVPTTINALVVGTGGGTSGTGSLTISSGALLSAEVNLGIGSGISFADSTEAVITTSADLSITGALTGNNTLTKAGAGTLTLSGAATRSTAAVYVASGVLNVAGVDALYDVSSAAVAPARSTSACTARCNSPT